MALQFTASEVALMNRQFFIGDFAGLLKTANISWDLQNLRNPTLDEVYRSDAVFCEEVQELELFLLGSENKKFGSLVIQYLSSLAVRSTILLMKVEHEIMKKSCEPIIMAHCDFDLLTKDITNEPKH